jgi:ribosomal protein S18 acetylase RimI-like enzyme
MKEFKFEPLPLNDEKWHEKICQLLALTVGNPTKEKLDEVINNYAHDPRFTLFGCIDPLDHLLAIIGIERTREGISIKHLAVSPATKYLGIGKWMLDELIKETNASYIYAETDDDAVGFYRKFGFKITPIESKYPPMQRYKCEWLK